MMKQKQAGLSLIELMIALVLGLLITAMVLEIFINNQQMYRVQDARARMQENGRYAINYISDVIRQSAYMGCATRSSSIPTNNTLNNATDYLYDFSTPIQGFNAAASATWLPTIDGSIINPRSASDVFTVRGVQQPLIRVTAHPGSNPPGSADIQVNAGNGLDRFDIVMVTDCLSAAIFQITSANPNTSGSLTHNTGVGVPGNATKALGKDYTDAEIIRLSTRSLYISENADAVPSLYQRIDGNAAQELVQDVEEMQIVYGIDIGSDDAADQYVTADNVVNWSEVISVKVSILLRTGVDKLTVDGPQTYTFNGAVVVAADNRLRSVFTKTITLRNRTP